MNLKRIFIGIVAMLLVQSSVKAGNGSFDAPEFGYKLFGTWASRDREDFKDDQLGLGAGVNYFFTPMFGVEAETYLEDVDWLNHADFSAIARYPLDSISVAPYGFVGFGRQWSDVSQWTCHIGGGAEYRWSGKTGVFFDVRRVFCDKSKDFTLLRLGVRLGF